MVISFVCSTYFIVVLNEISFVRFIVVFIIITILYIIAAIIKLYNCKGIWAETLVVLGLVISLSTTFVLITPQSYVVVVETDGYEVLRSKINFIGYLKAIKSEDIREVKKEITETRFYEFKDELYYYFVKIKIISRLRVSDDGGIYDASSDFSPGNAGKIVGYLEKIIKSGEEKKEIIGKELLIYAKENIKGFWSSQKIELLSFKKVRR